ncbi:TIGR02757 family protein [Pedobacter sandarakinus]|uniref:TIGR02757 family protein n=1 Tax=Pedobacter sandarakinus TaxID=353156 RepID=UPI0022463B5B|nr:TIGR02757 family protein [Pedobacter sandarakinus]MCX2575129.1 TIGR02757 family protein [Pedobacter sandarakinus]
MQFLELKNFLDSKVAQYNRPEFIVNDPICIPHLFRLPQDIEIAGFFAAILAWGQRKTIINKCIELMSRMDNAPYDFMLNHTDTDLKKLLGFKHRTFNDTDLLYFVAFFKMHYQSSQSLEQAFIPLNISDKQFDIETALNAFRSYFFSLEDFPWRTKKHISSPVQKSTCKRLNMFLRWMVRHDNEGVDFGLWKTLKPHQLVCPCDVHVDRVGRLLGLITRRQTDWQTAVALTESLKQFDPNDPVKYDFALFGLGVEKLF